MNRSDKKAWDDRLELAVVVLGDAIDGALAGPMGWRKVLAAFAVVVVGVAMEVGKEDS